GSVLSEKNMTINKTEFRDVLAEPISTHSYDRVWVYSSIGFESARLWGYRCLTALCALPLSCLCGGLFALLACITVSCHRCVMPCIQVFHICLPCVRSLWMSVVNIFIAPFCTSVARCGSGIYMWCSPKSDETQGGIGRSLSNCFSLNYKP
uniref:Caveolin n=1 Tax=Sinocyclocheilus grahami TaxID=75366 RepID=A0A672N1P5_SINGR